MELYRPISLFLAAVFAVVGIIFLTIPEQVLIGFNTLSRSLGMVQSPVVGASFYLILAVGYMYLVTVLAVMMYRHPDDNRYPMLLAHGKVASSVLSLGLFLFHQHYLIYLANFAIDGTIGLMCTSFYLKLTRRTR